MKTIITGDGLITIQDIPTPPPRESMINLDLLAESLGIKLQPSNLPAFQDLLIQELERHAHMPSRFPPRRCLSCGARTNDQGELPCGH